MPRFWGILLLEQAVSFFLFFAIMFIKPQITQCSLTISEQDIHFMRYALELADRAEAIGEIPVGAALVDQEGNIIGEGWNQVIQLSDPSAHAEMLAIRQAGKVQRNYRLLDCTLYVTLEPCTMCAGAILHSRLRRLVFGASDYKTGAIGSRFHLFEDYKMNHFLEIRGGVLAEECSQKISRFFQRRRQEQKRQKQAV